MSDEERLEELAKIIIEMENMLRSLRNTFEALKAKSQIRLFTEEDAKRWQEEFSEENFRNIDEGDFGER